ncbi:MAG: hypothetical protein QNL91_10265 [Candidatus Krumholzibacteria bacterium]|nr:hypothetical protein [Candidatus Krumholzibacteria bacterium]
MQTWQKILPLVLLMMALLATAAAASDWCGENGVIRFSFAEGQELVEVFDAGDPVNGVTTVDVYAWLADVDLVAQDGEKFLRVGGFELQLTIEGAEGFILSQEFPSQALNVGRKIGSIAAGMIPGQRLTDGQTLLVKWQVMFQGRPENVRFGLDAAGTMSCGTVEGCPEAAPQALYVGVESSGQLGSMFGAGYVPAWLNPTGEPDRTAVHAKQSYEEAGVFSKP